MAFVPLALALLLALVLSAPVEGLHGLGVPRSIGATVVVVGTLVLMAGAVDVLWKPCQEWYAAAPKTIKLVQRKLIPAAKILTELEELKNRAGSVTAPRRPAAEPPVAATVAPPENVPIAFFDAFRGIAASLLAFFMISLFLLVGGPPMLARMSAAFADDLHDGHVLLILEKVRAELGRFYVTTALINVGLGFATTAVMYLCGMPTPYLWGLVAALLNFIPYAGPLTMLAILSIVAMISFDNLNRVAVVALAYAGLTLLEGQIVQPMLVGRRLELNPLVVFLALWFGGLFWGIAGIVLATPALVALKVAAEHATKGKALLEFLGPNQELHSAKLLRTRLKRVFDGESG